MRYKMLSLILIFIIILSLSQVAFAGNVSIPDEKLKEALYLLSGIPTSEPLTSEQLAAITGDVDLSNKNISNMDGVQYLTGADSIDLSLNKIGNLPSGIEYLTALESLDLSGNKFTKMP